MKNLILIIMLFSLNAIGADKIEWSKSGLEGFGGDGLAVIVEDRHPTQKDQDSKAIKMEVEALLKNAGFKINDVNNSADYVWITIVPIKVNDIAVLHHAVLQTNRIVEYTTKAGKRYKHHAALRTYGWYPSKKSEKELVEGIVGQFIGDWKKANPKKENGPLEDGK